MTKHKFVVVAALAVMLVGTGSAGVHAWSGQRNTIRFGGAVALPGVGLPAGEYSFEVVRTASADVVRVSRANDNHAYYMGFTNRVNRPRALGDHAIVLGEAPAGSPQPIRVWYPTDGGDGHEFVY